MKLLQTNLILLLTAIINLQVLCQWKHLGTNFSIKETTSIEELTEFPEKYFNKDVRIEGIIASVCTNEGCFIEVISKDGKGEGIVVNFPELIYKFPTNCAGNEVIVEGMFYQKIYPKSRVSHWQEHSFRDGKQVPEFSLIKRINAKAVSIKEEKRDVPQVAEIFSKSTDKIDLNKMEFEADGFGCGRKVLLPGDSSETHSTGNYREIVYCLEGELMIIKGGTEPITINSGEMSFIPQNTKHAIKNKSDKPAVYFFVFSKNAQITNEDH